MKLSKKHGLQPVVPLCPWCRKPKNQVALLGAAGDSLARSLGRKDGDMPMYAVIPGDVELCEECASKGVQVIEAVKDKKGKPRVTGRFFVLKEEAIDHMLNDPETVRKVKEAGKMFVDKTVADMLQAAAGEEGEGGKEEANG